MRYLPLTDNDRHEMLGKVGLSSVDSLFSDVPEIARLSSELELPDHKGEFEVEKIIESLAGKNVSTADVPSFLGAGAYRHHIPAAVDYLIQRGEFLTSYTPYQPEISQGRLEALLQALGAILGRLGVLLGVSWYPGGQTPPQERVTSRFLAAVNTNQLLAGS